MKLVIQRVTNAKVEVDNKITGEIKEGLMVLVGFGLNDTTREVDYLASKLVKLRIFEDENEKMNLSIRDIGGKLLLVPQFTLYGRTKKNRPSFHKALNPTKASELFDYFVGNKSYENQYDISKSTAKRDLSNLMSHNLIRRIIIDQTYYFMI